jgi:DNA-binding NtrC family response regulator
MAVSMIEMKKLKQVVIVEDNIFYQELIKKHFHDKDYQVSCFETGEDFFAFKLEPDLLILDYNLSGEINGLDVLKRYKDEGNDVPVIFLSGQKDMKVAVDSLKSGAFDYVIKNEDAFNQIDQAISRFIIFSEARQKKNKRNLLKFFRKKA